MFILHAPCCKNRGRHGGLILNGLESESSSSGSVPGLAGSPCWGLGKGLYSHTGERGRSSGNELTSKQPMRTRGGEKTPANNLSCLMQRKSDQLLTDDWPEFARP